MLDNSMDKGPMEKWLWGPSSLSRHVSNLSRDRGLGPRFQSHSRHVIVWYHNEPAIKKQQGNVHIQIFC